MKRYREFREECIILEHPNLKARIIAKINPMDAIRDKMDDLKKLPGELKDKAINKAATMMTKDKISDLVDKKRDLTIKAKAIGTKIKSLRAKTK